MSNNYAASFSETSSFDPQQLFEGTIESQSALNRQIMHGGLCDKKVQLLLTRYQADLPTHSQALQHIEAVTQRHSEWANEFNRKIHHLQNPHAYRAIRYPSRMVFYGPPGCGKTFTALALAKVCNMDCLLIHGSSVETSYRRSGPDFLDSLFQTLLDYPERRFMLIFDELKYLAQYSKDERETAQHATVMKLWQCLDQIEKERHICVVGTDNLDPKEYEPQMQTRLFNSTFKFNQTDRASATRLGSSVLSSVMENRLSSDIPSSLNEQPATSTSAFQRQSISRNTSPKVITWNASEKKLEELTVGISHLTEREKLELMDAAAEIAVFQESIEPSDNSEIVISEHHVHEAFSKYRRTRMQQFFAHPMIKQLYSVRALSYYLAAASFGLRIVDTAYTPYSAQLLAASQIINALNSNEAERALGQQLFSSLHNIIASHESDCRYRYALKCEQDAIKRDADRHQQSRDDRAYVLKRDSDRYEESRSDLREDLLRDADRYAESRKDRDMHIRRQIEQVETLQYISLRGQYLKNLDISMHILDQRLQETKNIENMQDRSAMLEQLWKEFENDLVIETNNKYHEISHNNAIRARVFSSEMITAIKEFYTLHERSVPADMRLFVAPRDFITGYR